MNLSTNSDQLLVSRLLISLSPVLCRCGDGSIAAALAGELPKEKAGVGIYRSSGVQKNRRMKSQMDQPAANEPVHEIGSAPGVQAPDLLISCPVSLR